MQETTPERSIKDRTAVHQAGTAGVDLLVFAIDVVAEAGAYRAELGLDGFRVVFCGVQASHECSRAELMAREMNGDAGHAPGAIAPKEGDGRRANAKNFQCESPVVPQRDHSFRSSWLRGGLNS